MQVARQVVDAKPAALAVRHAGDVLVHGLTGIGPLLDAVQAGRKLHAEREVGIGRGVGHTVFAARRLPALRRHSDEGRHVLGGPRDVHGSFVAGDEPLVGVHQRICHGAVAARVPQQASDVPAADLGELNRPLGVEEGVLPFGEQGLMRVHPRPIAAVQRLGHEGRHEAVPHRDGPHHEAQARQMVGHRERVRVTQVDLVLAAGHLVMGRLRAQLHLLQRRHDDAPRLLSAVHRDEIEVAAGIERPSRRLATLALLEDEELHLAPDAHREAQLGGPLDLSFQGRAGTPLERPPVGIADIADEPRHDAPPAPPGRPIGAIRARALPGEHAEAREIRHQQGVGLLHAREPLERRAVERHLAGQRFLELGGGHLHGLVDAQQVGELEQQEPDAALLQLVEDVARVGGGGGHGH